MTATISTEAALANLAHYGYDALRNAITGGRSADFDEGIGVFLSGQRPNMEQRGAIRTAAVALSALVQFAGMRSDDVVSFERAIWNVYVFSALRAGASPLEMLREEESVEGHKCFRV